MNVQRQPKTIKAGTIISDLEPVAIIGTYVEDRKQMMENNETRVKTIEDGGTVKGAPQFAEDLINGADDITPESAVNGKGKGKGLSTCYSAAYRG